MKVRTGNRISLIQYVSLDWVLFLILWPFGAMVKALKTYRSRQAKTVFWLFCIYFGFVFIYEDPGLGKYGADSASYAAQLIKQHNNPFSFQTLFNSFYNTDVGLVDIYQPLVTWLVSLLTDDPRVLFALFAAVFGIFYTHNLWTVLGAINRNIGYTLLPFILVYALVNPIWNINGVRMWTAAQIFLFGNLRYFFYNDRKGLIWSAVSILVHFSFIFPVTILFGWFLLPKKDYLFLAFYFIAAFFLEIKLTGLRGFLSFLPDVVQSRVMGYTNESYIELWVNAKKNSSWHVIFEQKASTWIVYIWILAVYIRRKKWVPYLPGMDRLFMFALFMGGFANLAEQVAAGGRFHIVAKGLFYALFLAILGDKQIQLNLELLKKISIPILIFITIFSVRVGLAYSGILTFAANPLIAPFIGNQAPLIDFIKQLF